MCLSAAASFNDKENRSQNLSNQVPRFFTQESIITNANTNRITNTQIHKYTNCRLFTMLIFNYSDNELVASPTVLVSGKTNSASQGVVQFTNNGNKVFPPQQFEVNNGFFKALLHISSDEPNKFHVQVFDKVSIGEFGFMEGTGQCVDEGKLTLIHNDLPQQKPVHLCIILGRDSNGSYDMPSYRLKRGEVANLPNAIRKLKVAGRLMQALTQDEMRSNAFDNRTWQFVEESVHNQGIYGYNNTESPIPHQEIKVHVLRSPHTVAEIRDPNYAQQNPNASNSGWLYSHAIDLIGNSTDIFAGQHYKRTRTAIQCAVLYLDATFDIQRKLILAHAALGGGTNEVKLAIFGSHGLHSWPDNFPQVTPSFLDTTKLSEREVANDCNECGTSWECLNITMGAFMHEIGHHLGLPHQVNGIMLRDYVWFNRSFMTRENESLRTRTSGGIINRSTGRWDGPTCHWNRLDLVRFYYHDSFSLPSDDTNFQKIYSTTVIPDSRYEGDGGSPSLYTTPQSTLVKSNNGMYLLEFVCDDLARYSIEYLHDKGKGGVGFQREILLDYESCYQQLKQHAGDKAKPDFDVRILSLGGDTYIKDFKRQSKDSGNEIRFDFGLGRGEIIGFKSPMLGRNDNHERMEIAGFDINGITRIRVFHDGKLFGIRVFYKLADNSAKSINQDNNGGNVPPVPPRNYVKKLASALFSVGPIENQPTRTEGEKSSFVGREMGNYNDFVLSPGEKITKFNFKNGAWIDAVQFETNTGRKSQMYGHADGGHLTSLEAPSSEYSIVGLYGYTGAWMDGIGIFYSNE